MSETIRFAVYQEGPVLVAQGIERDIVSTGEDRDQLINRLDIVIRSEAMLPGGLDRILPPPEKQVSLWAKHGGFTVQYEPGAFCKIVGDTLPEQESKST